MVGSYHLQRYAPLTARSYPMFGMMPELFLVGDMVMALGLLPDEEVLARLHRSLGPRSGDWVIPYRPRMLHNAVAIDMVSHRLSFPLFAHFFCYFVFDGSSIFGPSY